MARTTFNRRPIAIDTPDSDDIEQQYFNHFNWKGINQNRNFLAVDQETFADANNVYVDDEGLLKSRLSFKFKYKFEDKKIKDAKVFDNIILCTYLNSNNEWCIGIIEDETWIIDYKIFADYPLKAFRNGDYLYIFTNEQILSYNIETKVLGEAETYSPITRVYTGINFDNYEDENSISSKNRYQYTLFPTITGDYVSDSINDNAYGKIATYTHFLDENKINHEVKIDSDNNFLNIIHQPLLSSNNFYIRNVYNTLVSTCIIRNNFIYRCTTDNIIQIASLSDGFFQNLLDINSIDDTSKFVKIKLDAANNVIVLFTNHIVVIDLNNTIDYVYLFKSHYVDYDRIWIEDDADYVDLVLYFDYNSTDTEKYYLYIDSFGSGLDNRIISRETTPITNINDCEIATDIAISTDVLGYLDGRAVSYSFKTNGYFVNNLILMKSMSLFVPDITTNIENTKIENSVYYYDITTPINYDNNIMYPSLYYEYNLLHEPLLYGMFLYSSSVKYGQIEISSNYLTFEHSVGLSPLLDYTIQYRKGVFLQDNTGTIEYINNQYRQFITNLSGTFIVNGNYWFHFLDEYNLTLSNYRLQSQNLYCEITKISKITDFDMIVYMSKIFASKGNKLFIGEIIIDDDEQEKLYFKKSYEHLFDNEINGFHQISDNEVAIFTKNDVWYNTLSNGIYYYNRSKIIPTLKNKSELITLPDSTTTLMPSTNGIIALSYQNFINTTEQSTVNLTQDLTVLYRLFNANIRVINWKQYVLFYENDNSVILIFDNRLQSWWRWTIPINVSTLFVHNDLLYAIADESIYEFRNETNDYFDLIENNKQNIDWYVQSQKMYLGANNYYKHIVNLTLASVEEGEQPISMNLNVKNYRKYLDNGKAENFDYDIDVIRTFVKRLNYAKVCEFQYTLSSDDENAINVPLSLSNITTKYKIGGQVR